MDGVDLLVLLEIHQGHMIHKVFALLGVGLLIIAAVLIAKISKVALLAHYKKCLLILINKVVVDGAKLRQIALKGRVLVPLHMVVQHGTGYRQAVVI